MRQHANGIDPHNTAMIEDLLKLGRRFRIPARGNESLAPHIGRVQTAKIKLGVEAIRRQLILPSDFEAVRAIRGLAPPQCGLTREEPVRR